MDTADPLRHLVDAAVAGDHIAITELVRRTRGSVTRVCSFLGSGADVDDLAQETYIRALGALPRYRADAPVEAWLLSIARRVCADSVRRRQRERRLLDRIRLTTEIDHLETVAADSWAELVEVLDADRREAFLLTQFVGMTYEEAAAVCGCPIGTIRSRVARARADLQRVVSRADAV